MKTYNPYQNPNPNFAYDPARYTLPETTGEFNATEEFLRRRVFEYLVDKDETCIFDIWVEVFGNNPNTEPSRKVSLLVGRILRSLDWKQGATQERSYSKIDGRRVRIFRRIGSSARPRDYNGDIRRIAENMGYREETNGNCQKEPRREEPSGRTPQNLKVLRLKREVPAAQPAADVTKLAAELLRAAAALLETQTTPEQNKKIL